MRLYVFALACVDVRIHTKYVRNSTCSCICLSVNENIYNAKNMYREFYTVCMSAAENKARAYHRLLEMEKIFPQGSLSSRQFT